MELRKDSKYAATPARVFMTVLIVLIGVVFLQSIIVEMVRMLPRTERAMTPKEPKEELSEEEKQLERMRSSVKEFLPDGTIHLVHQPGRRFYSQWEESGKQQIYDTNDNLLWEGIARESPYEYLSWAGPVQGDSFRQIDMKRMQLVTPELPRTLEIPVNSQDRTMQVWRYIPGRDCFTGYEARGGKIGYAGATGFVESKSEAQPFGKFESFIAWCPEGSYSPTLLWQTSRRIYQIDFEKQQVQLVFESPEEDIRDIYIHTWGSFKADTVERVAAKGYRPMLQCITKDGDYHLVMDEPVQKLAVKTPEDWDKWMENYCRFTATKQGIFLYRWWMEVVEPPKRFENPQFYDQWRRDYQAKPKKHWVELYKVDELGDIELVNRYGWTVPGGTLHDTRRQSLWLKAQQCVNQFSPPLYDVAVHLLGREFWSRAFNYQNRGDFFYSLARMILDIRPHGGVLNRILSALMMIFVFLHGRPRRTSWARFVFWLVFVGLFNLAGLLTYLALNHTPVIECPACGKRRGLAQVCCVRCLAELPAPRRRELDLIVDA